MLPINVDAGEYETEPEELFQYADLANIAAGAHAGSPELIEKTMLRCKKHRCRIGAHPSYPDRENFGRIALDISLEALSQSLLEQLSLLQHIAVRLNLRIETLKAHGALYHKAAAHPQTARLLLDTAQQTLPDLAIVLGPPGSQLEKNMPPTLKFWREGFADRGYTTLNTLIPRNQPGALLDPHQALSQAKILSQRKQFDTLCVHGDTPHATTILHRLKNP